MLVAGGSGPEGALSSAELFEPAAAGGAGAWTPTGRLSRARYLATATLLPDGRVLVAGGQDDRGGYLASAELYEPATGAFVPTGSLARARYLALAVPLPDGRVLVAGGYDGDALATAEVFDPAAEAGAGAFVPTGSLSGPRVLGTATALPDGRVLVAGGQGHGGNVLATAERFDPQGDGGRGAFSPVGSLATPRSLATATLLLDGRVLVAGGQDRAGPLASAELFDPRADAFVPTAPLSAPRTMATATRLGTGEVLVAGGFDGRQTLAGSELYLPVGRFVPAGALASGRSLATATWLPGGRVLIAGGQGSQVLSSAERFDRWAGERPPASKPAGEAP